MGFALALLVASSPSSLAGCKRGSSASEHRPVRSASVRLVPAAGTLEKLLPVEVAKARAQQLAPYVEIGAKWCKPCRQLEASMNDPRMKDAFDGTYVIHLDLDDWSGSLGPLALEPTVIPVLFEVDARGKSTGRSIDGDDWGATTAENVAPQLEAFFAKRPTN